MGSGGIIASPPELHTIIDSYVPIFIDMGMTINEFFHSDSVTLGYYRDLMDLRSTRKKEEINLSCWLNGIYLNLALGSAFEGSKYPDKPLPLSNEEEQKRSQEEEWEKIRTMMRRYNGNTNRSINH